MLEMLITQPHRFQVKIQVYKVHRVYNEEVPLEPNPIFHRGKDSVPANSVSTRFSRNRTLADNKN